MEVGDSLVAAGFREPVMDTERITLHYPGLGELAREARARRGDPIELRARVSAVPVAPEAVGPERVKRHQDHVAAGTVEGIPSRGGRAIASGQTDPGDDQEGRHRIVTFRE